MTAPVTRALVPVGGLRNQKSKNKKTKQKQKQKNNKKEKVIWLAVHFIGVSGCIRVQPGRVTENGHFVY